MEDLTLWYDLSNLWNNQRHVVELPTSPINDQVLLNQRSVEDGKGRDLVDTSRLVTDDSILQ